MTLINILNNFIANSNNKEIINELSSKDGFDIYDWFETYDESNHNTLDGVYISPTLVALAFVYSYANPTYCNLYWSNSEQEMGGTALYTLVFNFKGNHIPVYSLDLDAMYGDDYDLTTPTGVEEALVADLKNLWFDDLEFTTVEYNKYVKPIPLKLK